MNLMNQDNVTQVLEELITTCRDGEKGYQEAAEHVTQPETKTYFQEQGVERGRFAGELETQLSRLGKPGKKDSGSVSGAMHRAWIDVKASLGGGEKSILNSVEAGEDRAKEAYHKALEGALPPEVESLVRRQAQIIASSHDRVKLWRDRLAA